MPKNLRQASLEDIKDLLERHGEPSYRASQIWDWLWKKNVDHIDDMSNIPIALREKIKTEYAIPNLETAEHQFSHDGTIKTKIILHDQKVVEGVLIPAPGRMTACISSQVGCSLDCAFCATGRMDRVRNLNYDEIVDQVVKLNELSLKYHDQKLTNIVFMGMGEPLLNYNNTLKAIEKITAPDALAMSPRRITVSTAGISKMIEKLGDDEVRFGLALSLHAPNDEKRSQIMSINDTNNIEALLRSLNYFFAKTKRHITFEYLMLGGFNDTEKDALELVKIVRQVPSKVNLIEYNSTGDGKFQKSSPKITEKFRRILDAHKVNVRVRQSRGEDIDAACGQLANK